MADPYAKERAWTGLLKSVDATEALYKLRTGNYGWNTSGLQWVKEAVDSDGHLQVDVLSGGGGGSQYEDGTAVAGGQDGTVAMGTDGSNLQFLKTNSDGELIANIDTVGSVVDSNNSTTTPLTGGATYTGTGTDLLGYSAVCVTLYADVDSAASGMCFQFSSDNTNWDDEYAFAMDVSSSDTRRFQFPVTARYFRVVYTNGAGAQTDFRVQTILHTANQLTSIHRLGNDMTQDRSAQVVKAVLFGKGQGGSPDFKPVDVTNGGNLKVAIEESVNLDVTTASEGRTMVTKTVDATASQTAQTIWDPTTDTKFVITSIVITCTTAGIITLFDETNNTTLRVAKLDMSANSSGNLTYPDVHRISAAANNVLKYTTTTFVGSVTAVGYEI